jgi:hypothetical protein
MPTVLRFGAFRVMIYKNDHRPPHVHVLGRGGQAIFTLNCPAGPPELREERRLSGAELKAIKRALSANLQILCESWKGIHGDA